MTSLKLEHSTANCASEAGKADVVVEVKKERNVGRLQPEVDALEKAFEKIHNDYIHSADAEKHEKDYIGRAKVKAISSPSSNISPSS